MTNDLNRQRARAHSRAKSRLARRYHDEYRKMVDEEYEAMGLVRVRKRRTKSEMLADLEAKIERLRDDLTV